MNIKKVTLYILTLLSTQVFADNLEYSLELSSFSHANVQPIISIIQNDWKKRYKKGKQATTQNRFNFQIKQKNLLFGLSSRFDYLTTFTSETAFLIYQKKNKLNLIPNKTYRVDLNIKHLLANGIFLGYQNHINGFNFQVKTNLWYGNKVTYGNLNGVASTNDNNKLYGSLFIDYSYSKDLLFGRPEENNNAFGVSFDIKADWKITKQIKLNIELIDLYNKFYWQEQTHTTATVNYSAERSFFVPIISGKEDKIDIQLSLPIQAKLGIEYTKLNLTYKFGIDHYNQHEFPWFALEDSTLSNWGKVNLKLYPLTKVIAFGLKTKKWSINLALDSINIKKANSLIFEFGVTF